VNEAHGAPTAHDYSPSPRPMDHGQLQLAKPLHAHGMNLCDAALERCALNVFREFSVAEYLFQGNELELLESSGELGEVAPGRDAMPFGASLVISVVVLPALLGCDVEEDVLDGLKRALGGAFVVRLDSWLTATPSLAV
jgi:hypothetical protein